MALKIGDVSLCERMSVLFTYSLSQIYIYIYFHSTILPLFQTLVKGREIGWFGIWPQYVSNSENILQTIGQYCSHKIHNASMKREGEGKKDRETVYWLIDKYIDR